MNTYNNQYIIQLLMINHPPHEHTPPACDTTKVVMLFCGNFAADGNWIFCQCLDDFKHHVSIMHVDNSKSGKLTLWFKSPKNSREKIYLRSICFVLKPWKKHGMQQYRLSHVATQQIVWLLLHYHEAMPSIDLLPRSLACASERATSWRDGTCIRGLAEMLCCWLMLVDGCSLYIYSCLLICCHDSKLLPWRSNPDSVRQCACF